MSPEQARRFYFPEWNGCCRANQWRTEHGRLVQPREPVNVMHRELLAKVYAVRDQLALKVAAPLDALRHACHIVALTKNKSSKELTNDEVTRVVDLFRVLAEPDNLKYVAHWTDPELSKKKNLMVMAKAKAPWAYIVSIMTDKFHTEHLDELSVGQLQKLCFTLNQRKKQWNRPRRNEGREVFSSAPF